MMVGGSNHGLPTVFGGGGGGGIFGQPGFEPPTKKSAACCITIRPLLDYAADQCTAGILRRARAHCRL